VLSLGSFINIFRFTFMHIILSKVQMCHVEPLGLVLCNCINVMSLYIANCDRVSNLFGITFVISF
jgi:hypothetical protein